MRIATGRIIQDPELLTDLAIAPDGLDEAVRNACDSTLGHQLAELAEEARFRVGALATRISRGVADYGLVPLNNLTAIARIVPVSSDGPAVALATYPTDLLESKISAGAVGRLSQVLRDPVSKLALFAKLVAHGPVARRSYYEATLAAEIRSLARLIDQLSRLACLMGPASGPLASMSLDQLADVVRDELGSLPGDMKPPLVTHGEADRSVRVDGRPVGEALRNIVAALPHARPGCRQVQVKLATECEWLAINLQAPAFEISADSLAQRFEPFCEGTMDLGLILARTIISRHAGFIAVKDCVAGGVATLWLANGARESGIDDMT